MPSKSSDATISLKTKDLTVDISGSAEAVQRVYQSLQGEIGSIAPNVLTNGGDMSLSVKGVEKKSEE